MNLVWQYLGDFKLDALDTARNDRKSAFPVQCEEASGSLEHNFFGERIYIGDFNVIVR